MKIKGPNGVINVNLPSDPNHTPLGEGIGDIFIDEGASTVDYAIDGDGVWVVCDGFSARFTHVDAHGEDTDHEARAPMTGKVVTIPVKIGDTIKRGDTVAVLEAMKMEYKLEAEADGTVEEIGANEGDLVDLGQLLVRLK